MTAAIRDNEFRLFLSAQKEAIKAIEAGDVEEARFALSEVQMFWMHTAWPRLREQAAAFLRRYAQRDEFTRFAV